MEKTLNIAAIADLHGATDMLERILVREAGLDLLLLSGDITHFGGEPEVREIVELAQEFVPRILGVAGNCDESAVEKFLIAKKMSLHMRASQVDGFWFMGMGMSLPCPGITPGETTEEGFAAGLEEARLEIPAKRPFALVTHEPVFGTKTDVAYNGKHVGSHAIRRFVEKHAPEAVVSGHMHESKALDSVGKTRIVNPGPAGKGNYAFVQLVSGHIASVELRSCLT